MATDTREGPELRIDLVDSLAISLMAARMQAAWTNPEPTSAAYDKANTNRPPGTPPLHFVGWLAQCAYEDAITTMKVRHTFTEPADKAEA